MTVVMSSGIMIAVPLAWTTRPTSRISKPGAIAAIPVPRLKSDMARMNTVRVLRRCMRNPVVGITTAMVSMNAVDSHWAVLAGMLRSAMTAGIATPMIVSLRNTTNVATSMRLMTRLLRLLWSGADAPAAGTDPVWGEASWSVTRNPVDSEAEAVAGMPARRESERCEHDGVFPRHRSSRITLRTFRPSRTR